MAVGGNAPVLDSARDTLINVNAFGDPVASARFMGGRDYETLTVQSGGAWSARDVEMVLSEGIIHLPSVQSGSGPYPNAKPQWVGREPAGGDRVVASAFYLALMTATCLDLIGADGPIFVEGPLAANTLFTEMLQAATGRAVLPQADHATGTSIGAALLAREVGKDATHNQANTAPIVREQWQSYATKWRDAVNRGS